MRNELFPVLNASLGKRVEGALAEAAREAHELQEFLKEEAAGYPVENGPFGQWMDLRDPPHFFLLKSLIDNLLKSAALPCFKEEILALAHAIVKKSPCFTKVVGKRKVIADRGNLFILNSAFPALSEWRLDPAGEEEPLGDWRALWRGRAVGLAPHPALHLHFGAPELNRWWTAHKVPAFLRGWAPILRDEQGPVHEFLSGKTRNPALKGAKIAVSLVRPSCTPKGKSDRMKK